MFCSFPVCLYTFLYNNDPNCIDQSFLQPKLARKIEYSYASNDAIAGPWSCQTQSWACTVLVFLILIFYCRFTFHACVELFMEMMPIPGQSLSCCCLCAIPVCILSAVVLVFQFSAYVFLPLPKSFSQTSSIHLFFFSSTHLLSPSSVLSLSLCLFLCLFICLSLSSSLSIFISFSLMTCSKSISLPRH